MLASEDELLPRAPGARAAAEDGVAWDAAHGAASPDGPVAAPPALTSARGARASTSTRLRGIAAWPFRPRARALACAPRTPLYPRALFDLGARRPPELYLRGVTPWPGGPRVAIVGARAATAATPAAPRAASWRALVAPGRRRRLAAWRAAWTRRRTARPSRAARFTVARARRRHRSGLPARTREPLHCDRGARPPRLAVGRRGGREARPLPDAQPRARRARRRHVVLVQADAHSGSRHTVACGARAGARGVVVPWPLGHAGVRGERGVGRARPPRGARAGAAGRVRSRRGRRTRHARTRTASLVRAPARGARGATALDRRAGPRRARRRGRSHGAAARARVAGDAVRAPGDRFKRRST